MPIETAATGTTTTNTARQPRAVTKPPPSTGPAANPTPDTPPHTPRARDRACPSGNRCAINANEQGTTAAAPMPCTARAAIRTGAVGAAAHAALATANSAEPLR